MSPGRLGAQVVIHATDMDSTPAVCQALFQALGPPVSGTAPALVELTRQGEVIS